MPRAQQSNKPKQIQNDGQHANGLFSRNLKRLWTGQNFGERQVLFMAKWKVSYEEIKLQAENLVEKVKELIHEGNVRRIIIKDEKGNTFIEIPVTVAAVTAVATPILAAVGTIAALVANFKIVVVRSKQAS